MPERASVTQSNQIGVESTPGTAVAANKLLSSLAFTLGQQVNMNRYRPMGQKFASQIVPGREWTELGLAGVGNYNELVYPLSSVCVAETPDTVDTTARSWVFTPAARTEDTVKTFTLEEGGAVRAQRAAYGLVTSLEMTINRDEWTLGGGGIAQRLEDDHTMTATPTAIAEKIILPNHIDVWLDETAAELGDTQLTRAFEAVFNIGDRFNPVWPLNSSHTSYASHVETEPAVNGTLFLEADDEGMALLPVMRAGATRFLRIKATSTELAGAATEVYSAQIDAAIKISDAFSFEDADGVYAARWPFEVVFDATWTKAFEVTVVNTVAAL